MVHICISYVHMCPFQVQESSASKLIRLAHTRFALLVLIDEEHLSPGTFLQGCQGSENVRLLAYYHYCLQYFVRSTTFFLD